MLLPKPLIASDNTSGLPKDIHFVATLATKAPESPPDMRQNYQDTVVVPAQKAAEAARRAAAAKAAQAAVRAIQASQVAPQAVTPPSGSHQDWMSAAGIAQSDWGYVDYIVSHESGWSTGVRNSEGSGAYGLGQALPASKMAPFGSDYLTNPVTQLRWASSYAVARYGSWYNAYAHWISARSW